jgi:hypothetical protein
VEKAFISVDLHDNNSNYYNYTKKKPFFCFVLRLYLAGHPASFGSGWSAAPSPDWVAGRGYASKRGGQAANDQSHPDLHRGRLF